jgi:hypothetical protein
VTRLRALARQLNELRAQVKTLPVGSPERAALVAQHNEINEQYRAELSPPVEIRFAEIANGIYVPVGRER